MPPTTGHEEAPEANPQRLRLLGQLLHCQRVARLPRGVEPPVGIHARAFATLAEALGLRVRRGLSRPITLRHEEDARSKQPVKRRLPCGSSGSAPLRTSTADIPRRAAAAAVMQAWFDWIAPKVMTVVAPNAWASAIRYSSLRALLPPGVGQDRRAHPQVAQADRFSQPRRGLERRRQVCQLHARARAPTRIFASPLQPPAPLYQSALPLSTLAAQATGS